MAINFTGFFDELIKIGSVHWTNIDFVDEAEKTAATVITGAKQKIKFGPGLKVRKGGSMRIGKYVEGKGVPITLDSGKIVYMGHAGSPASRGKLDALPPKEVMDKVLLKVIMEEAAAKGPLKKKTAAAIVPFEGDAQTAAKVKPLKKIKGRDRKVAIGKLVTSLEPKKEVM